MHRPVTAATSKTDLKVLISAIGVLLALLASIVLVPPAKGQLLRLSVVESTFDSVFAYPFIAAANGYFHDAGVDVTILGGVGANSLNFVSTGRSDLAMIGTASSFLPTSQGRPMSVVYNFSGGGLGGDVVVRKESAYSSLVELGGKRLGTIGVGGSAYGAVQLYSQYSQRHGGGAFVSVPFQDASTLAASLRSGQIEAAVGPEGWFDTGIASGAFRILVDTTKSSVRETFFGGYYAENSIFGLTDNLRAKREAVTRFLEGISRADAWVHHHTPEQIADTLASLPDFKAVPYSAGVASARYTYYFWTPYNGMITRYIWNRSLKQFALWGLPGIDVSSAEFSYDRRVDMSYLQEAEKRLGMPPKR